MSSNLPRIITKRQLLEIVPYSAQHILRLEKKGLFPKRLVIGPDRVGWWLAEIEDHLTKCAQAGGSARKPQTT